MSNDTDEIPTPRENDYFTGHEAAVETLSQSFHSDRFHHAWLVSGPEGIGKATLMWRFARYVLADGIGFEKKPDAGAGLFGALPDDAPETDENEEGGDATLFVSPDHPVFQRIKAGGHADILGVERSINKDTGKLRTEIVVDDVRGIGTFLRKTAAEGGWRIVIIDAADEMNVNAANAVLKVLEEPPKRAMLLLVAHNPGRLLPTIRSRCRKLSLNALPDKTVQALVHRSLCTIPDRDAATLAQLAEGSIGRALALDAEGGVELYRDLLDLLETLPRLNVTRLHAFADRVARDRSGNAFRTVSGLLGWWLHRFVRYQTAGEAGMGLSATEEALMGRLSVEAPGLDQWLGVWDKMADLFARTDAVNLDRKQIVLNAFLALEDAAKAA